MIKLVLTDEQAELLANSNGADVMIYDSNGRRLGCLQRPTFTDEETTEAKRRADAGGPWYTTEEVLAHLRSLLNDSIHSHLARLGARQVGHPVERVA